MAMNGDYREGEEREDKGEDMQRRRGETYCECKELKCCAG